MMTDMHQFPQSSLEGPRPLRIAFVLTSMPLGGAETLLADLVRRLDRDRFSPEIICLKQLDVLGEQLATEIPVSSDYLTNKYDVRVLMKLLQHFANRELDAVITVGAGDKMFWGRLAAYLSNTPVVISALHSTGWPDGIGHLNRLLSPITDAFVAVADEHGRYLRDRERLPANKVRVIPNGVDTARFAPDLTIGNAVRQELRIPLDAPVASIVAVLRPEKDHRLFLEAAQHIRRRLPDSRFLIVGDGPQREELERYALQLGLTDAVYFLGARRDVPALLCATNVLLLTSKNEANPVSILEALSAQVPVVATRVGSVPSTVIDGQTGYLAIPGDAPDIAEQTLRLLNHPDVMDRLGRNGREAVCQNWSVDAMVRGYEQLISETYHSKFAPIPAASKDGPMADPTLTVEEPGNALTQPAQPRHE